MGQEEAGHRGLRRQDSGAGGRRAQKQKCAKGQSAGAKRGGRGHGTGAEGLAGAGGRRKGHGQHNTRFISAACKKCSSSKQPRWRNLKCRSISAQCKQYRQSKQCPRLPEARLAAT